MNYMKKYRKRLLDVNFRAIFEGCKGEYDMGGSVMREKRLKKLGKETIQRIKHISRIRT